MWERKDLKDRAKTALHRNYWRCVLIALILGLFVYNYSSGDSVGSDDDDTDSSSGYYIEETEDGWNSYGGVISEKSVPGRIQSFAEGIYGLVPTTISAFVTLSFVLGAVLVALSIFVFNILEVGGCKFFTDNTQRVQEEERTGLGTLFWGFESGRYLNLVKIILIRDIKIFLWSLLLVIPGIVKSYEYRMVPYILGDDPSIDSRDAFKISREMMDGNKFDAFVLDLSFIGWKFLGALTFGLVNLFWTNPYEYATNAELYLALRDGADGSFGGFRKYQEKRDADPFYTHYVSGGEN